MNVKKLQSLTKCGEWHSFNNLNISISENLFKNDRTGYKILLIHHTQIPGLGTKSSEYTTLRFPDCVQNPLNTPHSDSLEWSSSVYRLRLVKCPNHMHSNNHSFIL
jgi:hypothetical protein